MSKPRLGASPDGAEVAERIDNEALDTRKKVFAAIRYAATFHDGVEKLVDVEEYSEEDKKTPKCVLAFKEAEGRKYRMVSALEGKKKFHCTRCGMRS